MLRRFSLATTEPARAVGSPATRSTACLAERPGRAHSGLVFDRPSDGQTHGIAVLCFAAFVCCCVGHNEMPGIVDRRDPSQVPRRGEQRLGKDKAQEESAGAER